MGEGCPYIEFRPSKLKDNKPEEEVETMTEKLRREEREAELHRPKVGSSGSKFEGARNPEIMEAPKSQE